jgi:imidazole glycerol-phosphate synthase subunit HisH
LINKITIIDYEASNIKSLYNSFKYLGQNPLITSDIKEIMNSEKIILPGVGSYVSGMKNLKKFKIDQLIKEKYLNNESIIFGICLGMQLLFESSEEKKYTKGIGLLKGQVSKFDNNTKIPHMGFNNVKYVSNSLLFKDIPQDSDFYFANSYRIEPSESYAEYSSITNYGGDFISAIEFKNLIGTQFHPEKSHEFGLNLLKNFIELNA